MARATCTACNTVFASVSAFDTHRAGDYARGGQRPSTRHCLREPAMRAAGLVMHPTRTHAGRPVWTLEVSLQRWEARKGILGDTHAHERPETAA
jgi:hypothetical protein